MRYLIVVGIIGISLSMAFVIKHPSPKLPFTEVSKASSVSSPLKDEPLTPPEIVLGNQDAKDTVTMYFAPTCHHCAEYEKKILPQIDKEFIQTGKIKFVMKILPFHSLDFAVGKIALFQGKEHFQKTITLFLENQEKWLAPIYEEAPQKEKLLKAKIQELSTKLNIEAKIIESSLNVTLKDELAFIKLFCLENGWSLENITNALKTNPEAEKLLASSHLKAIKKNGEMLDYVPAFFINEELQENWVKPESLRARI